MNRRTFLKAAPAIALMSALTAAPRSRAVVVVGNSLSALNVAAYPQVATCWPTLLGDMLPSWAIVNTAQGGGNIEDAERIAPAYIDALAPALDTAVVVYEGGNHIAQRTQSGAASFARHRAFCEARHAAGAAWIVLATIPARSASVMPSWWAGERDAFNVLARESWREFADVLVDVAALPEMQRADDARYFYDGVHTTREANEITARAFAAAIAGLHIKPLARPAVSCLALPLIGR